MKTLYYCIILLSTTVLAFDQDATYLVLNHFDKPLPNIDQTLVDNFNNSSFSFDQSVDVLFEDLDEDDNPASKYMNDIKDLGL